VGGQRHTPTALLLRERPGTRFTGGWVGLRPGLDGCGETHPHGDSIPGPSSPKQVAIPHEPTRLPRVDGSKHYFYRNLTYSGLWHRAPWYLLTNFLGQPTVRGVKSKANEEDPPLTRCPQTSVNGYQHTTRNIPEGRISHVYSDGILKCHSFLQLIYINHLKPTGHVMHRQFNIQQLYVLPTLYLCVLCLSENKQWLVPLTA